MIFFFLAVSAWASNPPLVSLDSVLERPMESRLKELKRLKPDESRKFLASTAFDINESLATRWRAITTMGRLDHLEFRPELDRALRSPEWFVRNAALIALLHDERPRALSWSIKMLDDNALVVRTQAVRNLIGLNAVEAEPQLWAQMFSKRNYRSGESLWIRAHAAEALARLSAVQPGRTKSFMRLLSDPDERLHSWAVMGLENSTSYKMSHSGESLEVRRQKWLALSDTYL